LEEGLRFDSTAAYIYLELTINYTFNTFDFKLAAEFGKRAIDLSPNCAAAYFLVGNAYISLGFHAKAIP